MNMEFLENAMKARKYGEAAMKALIPEDFKKHMDVIENEMTDLAMEYLQKRKKRHGFGGTDSMKQNGEQPSNGNVKKVTID